MTVRGTVRRRLAQRGLAMGALLSVSTAMPLVAQRGFPHAEHQGLFPLCTGCHGGAVSGDSDRLYPGPASCEACHDGDMLARVRWSPPAAPRTPFSHPAHARVTRETERSFDCRDCHTEPGGASMRVVTLSVGEACYGCHATHSGDSRCRLCHTPSRDAHDRAAHRSCDQCHEAVAVDALPRTRNFCLLCHQDMKDHRPDRTCTACHPVGQP